MSLPARHTPRANWHKYNGAEYFVTICTGGREHYFGEVHDGQTQLTAVGECLRAQIENVQNHYPYATIPLYVIMPNHTHLIAVIDGDKTPYDRTVCRDAACHVRNDSGANDVTDAARDVPTTARNNNTEFARFHRRDTRSCVSTKKGAPIGSTFSPYLIIRLVQNRYPAVNIWFFTILDTTELIIQFLTDRTWLTIFRDNV